MVLKKQLCWILKLIFVVILTNVHGFMEEGERCKVSKRTTMTGICTVVTKCQLALDAMKSQKAHRLNRCGFTEEPNAHEIVCCPPTFIVDIGPKKPVEEPVTERPITNFRQYCEKISKNPTAKTHIRGGVDASEGEFSHMAALGYLGRDTSGDLAWKCGATIIAPNYFLTAAHCITDDMKKIRFGMTKLDDPNAKELDIAEKISHEDYNYTSKHNDIALLRVDVDIEFGEKVYPACLYGEENDPENLTITGWGLLEDNTELKPDVLQKAQVPIIAREKCNETYFGRSFGAKRIINSQICYHSKKGIDSCRGDSGGPGQIKIEDELYSIAGIVSYGDSCGGSAPGVYTRVASYMDWINKKVWGTPKKVE